MRTSEEQIMTKNDKLKLNKNGLFGNSEFKLMAAEAGRRPLCGLPDYNKADKGLSDHLRVHAQIVDMWRPHLDSVLAGVLDRFVLDHDYGYSADGCGLLAKTYYRENEVFYTEAFADHIKRNFPDYKDISWGTAKEIYSYGLACLSHESPLVQNIGGRIIMHGINSIPFMKRRLLRAGVKIEAACGYSSLVATHHIGYPLTRVVNFARQISVQLPGEHLLEIMCVSTPTTQTLTELGEPEIQSRCDALRQRLAHGAAPKLGVTKQDASLLAALFYAMDRITPSFLSGKLTFKAADDWSFDGGEYPKRLSIAVKDALALKKTGSCLSIAELMSRTLASALAESQVCIQTAQNLEAFEVLDLIEIAKSEAMRRTLHQQMMAKKELDAMRLIVFDNLNDLELGIEELTSKHRFYPQNQGIEYALATLLITKQQISITG